MKTSNSIDNPWDKKTQIKFRTSEFFNEALNSFWRHLKKDYPEKYGMVNSKGKLKDGLHVSFGEAIQKLMLRRKLQS